jgi:hypothetical protein
MLGRRLRIGKVADPAGEALALVKLVRRAVDERCLSDLDSWVVAWCCLLRIALRLGQLLDRSG